METSFRLESAKDIDKIVYDILKQSRSFDVFPTPVETIVKYAELLVEKGVGLHDIPNHYISKKIDALKKALSKVFGALDRKRKIIYLNPEMNNGKKSFVQLHEVGHHTLPWQRTTFDYVEDEHSLNPYVQEQFEAEANYFASDCLFQLDRFENDIETLPLEIASVKYLAQKYGASIQATFRRYVEKLSKRAALLVLTEPSTFHGPLTVRNWFTSKRFATCYPNLQNNIPENLPTDWPFIQDYYSNRRWIDRPQLFSIKIDGENLHFDYRFFFNRHNIFVLIVPRGEKVVTRTSIVLLNES